MSYFKIKPFVSVHERRKPGYCRWLVFIAIETLLFSFWVFQLNNKITDLEQQLKERQEQSYVQ